MDSLGQRLKSQTEKIKEKDQKRSHKRTSRASNVLPDSARAQPRVRTKYRTVYGVDLVRYPAGVDDYYLSPQDLVTLDNRTPR